MGKHRPINFHKERSVLLKIRLLISEGVIMLYWIKDLPMRTSLRKLYVMGDKEIKWPNKIFHMLLRRKILA